jgi:hypothetical protein
VARSIFVGDVHSCAAELADLFDAVALVDDDSVYFVGDLLSRGPDTRGVLRLFRAVRGQSALGNHEQRLLAARAAMARNEPGPRAGSAQAALMAELDAEDWALLAGLPLALEVPNHGVRVVHAGVAPGVPFEEQDPWLLTHIRSIDEDGMPSERWGKPWGTFYSGPEHVVFGHNARKLPQLHPYATGLDTGCVYGNALTALVLAEGQKPPPVEARQAALISVPARATYADYGRELSVA